MVADFRREYGLGFREVMALPARQFYLYLWGLSTKSRWMTAMTAAQPAKTPQTASPAPTSTNIIRDKAKAVSILFGPWQQKE